MAECTSCGGFVTDDYVRVFGDNEGNISECRSCRARSSPSEEDDTEDADERVVLLRDVAGDDSTGEDGNESENERAAVASDTGATPESGGTSVSSSGEAASDAPEQGASGAESGGARERIAGFFSSIRG
jgi:hypothetical protein